MIADKTKVGNQQTVKKRGYPELSWSGQCHHRVLKSRRRGQSDVMGERLNLQLLVLKVEEGPTSQGTQVDSRSWKRQENRFSSSASRKEDSPADTLILAF